MQRTAGESEQYLLVEAAALRFILTPCQGLKDISGVVQCGCYFWSSFISSVITLYSSSQFLGSGNMVVTP